MSKKTVEISEELYNAMQQLKQIFSQMTWNQIEDDEQVLWILIWGFIDSLNAWNFDEHWDDHWDHECCGWHWEHWDDHECCGSWNCKDKDSKILLD